MPRRRETIEKLKPEKEKTTLPRTSWRARRRSASFPEIVAEHVCVFLVTCVHPCLRYALSASRIKRRHLERGASQSSFSARHLLVVGKKQEDLSTANKTPNRQHNPQHETFSIGRDLQKPRDSLYRTFWFVRQEVRPKVSRSSLLNRADHSKSSPPQSC